MTDYSALNRRLWQLVAEMDGRLETRAAALVAKLMATLAAEGYTYGPETAAELTAYLDGFEGTLREGIQAALQLGAVAPMRDEVVAQLAQDAFEARRENGFRLSERLWRLRGETVTDLQRVLSSAARTGRSANAVVYDLQRAIETRGARFQIEQKEIEDWTTRLALEGQLAQSPEARKAWTQTVRTVRSHIEQLAETGTRHAAQTALKKIVAAIAEGNQEALGKALYWWQYDKQLYLLKRIARTEMATAQHRAVIASTQDDPDIIGYQWRLSSSHPTPDICDYYASIEMGLGRGVWSKEAVPQHKAHPHCMCLLVPRVTPVRQAGDTNLMEFIRGTSPERRSMLLPAWTRRALASGMKLDELVRPDGMWFLSRQEAIARYGAEAIGAAA